MNRLLLSSFLLTLCSVTLVANAAEVEIPARNLQDFGGEADFYVPEIDLCDNSVGVDTPPELGPCDESRFPRCGSSNFVCYNRKPARDLFYDDNHQPIFYIQYDRIFCYPGTWGSCSSCTPGRFCKSEARCILDEEGYPCEEWF